MTVFRRVIARVCEQAPAELLAEVAHNTDPQSDIISVPLANSRNEFSEDPMRNTGRVRSVTFDGQNLIADLDVTNADAADRLARGLVGVAALVDKATRKLRGAGLTLRSGGAPIALTAAAGGSDLLALTADNGEAPVVDAEQLLADVSEFAAAELSAAGYSADDVAGLVSAMAGGQLQLSDQGDEDDDDQEDDDMAATADLTRSDLDTAYLELSAATGVSTALVRDAALELAGHGGAGNVTFGSLAEEVEALAQLAQMTGITGGARVDPQAANSEILALAGRHPEFFDVRKAAAFTAYDPPAGYCEAGMPAPTAAQEAEINRLLGQPHPAARLQRADPDGGGPDVRGVAGAGRRRRRPERRGRD